MPHVNIKHFPKDLTDGQRMGLSRALTAVVAEYLGTDPRAVSIALEPVAPQEWNDTVVTPEIGQRAHLLVKIPDYEPE